MMQRSELLERIAILTAAKKELEAELDALRADYEVGMPDSGTVQARVCGEPVGFVRRRWSKERHELVCEDVGEFVGWLRDDGIGYLEEFVRKSGRRLLDACGDALIADGEIPAGCRVVDIPSYCIGIEVRGCAPDDVRRALGAPLPEAAMRLLGDGADA